MLDNTFAIRLIYHKGDYTWWDETSLSISNRLSNGYEVQKHIVYLFIVHHIVHCLFVCRICNKDIKYKNEYIKERLLLLPLKGTLSIYTVYSTCPVTYGHVKNIMVVGTLILWMQSQTVTHWRTKFTTISLDSSCSTFNMWVTDTHTEADKHSLMWQHQKNQWLFGKRTHTNTHTHISADTVVVLSVCDKVAGGWPALHS